MSIKVKDILSRVRVLLQDRDEGGIRWLDDELVGWFNEAMAEITRLHPESSAVNKVFQLVAGTKQSIPSGGTMLLQVVRNFTTESLAGRAVKLVDREIMDRENPDWHTDTAKTTVLRYVFDPLDPRNFYVYPPQPTTAMGYLEVIYSTVPDEVTVAEVITDNTATFPLPAIYLSQAINYVCYRAYQKNLNDADALARSQEFYTLFNNGVQSTESVKQPRNPNVNNAPR